MEMTPPPRTSEKILKYENSEVVKKIAIPQLTTKVWLKNRVSLL